MAYSLKRIGRQARKLGIFDEVVLHTPDSLPEYVRSCELMKHTYGGGYWAWKPALIWETLQRAEEGDVVCYVDAGCTLHKTTEWDVYFELMKKYDTMLFAYPDRMPLWEKFGTTSTAIKHWTKKTAVDFYDAYVGNEMWREHNKVLGGFIFAKGRDNRLIESWKDIVLEHPEVIDDSGVFDEQYPFFARHKHDQPALTALSCKYSDSCIVMPELLDEGPDKAAVVATRIRAGRWSDSLVWHLKRIARRILGERLVGKIKETKKA